MQNQSMLYGVIGLLVGVLITVFVASSSVNNNNQGMMRMMGMHTDNLANTSSGTMMSSNIDRHFIEQMIPHHEDAIIMANFALEKATNAEIKKLAEDIIKAQTDEIEKMRGWYKNWYGVDVLTVSNTTGMGMRMHGGMMGDQADIDSLKNATNFDRVFIEEMIPHHQMAVMMANILSAGTEKPEMKQLAQDITAAQTKEINEMRGWYSSWYK